MRISALDDFSLSVNIYPIDTPQACIQIVHGAKEFKERYHEFALYLNSIGYNVIVADLRGHGHSVNVRYPLGYMDDYHILVEDINCVRKYIQEFFELPVIMFGHSFGSILTRIYLQNYDHYISHVILSGTVNYLNLSLIDKSIERLMNMQQSMSTHSKNLARYFPMTDYSWTNVDNDEIDKFIHHPLSDYQYYDVSLLTILKADKELNQRKHFKCQHPSLPILMISGQKDPVTGGPLGIHRTIHILERIGYTNIQSIVYPTLKHELINTIGKEIVWHDIKEFLKQ